MRVRRRIAVQLVLADDTRLQIRSSTVEAVINILIWRLYLDNFAGVLLCAQPPDLFMPPSLRGDGMPQFYFMPCLVFRGWVFHNIPTQHRCSSKCLRGRAPVLAAAAAARCNARLTPPAPTLRTPAAGKLAAQLYVHEESS